MATTLHEPARETEVLARCDVLVVGGGSAGSAAAIAAARQDVLEGRILPVPRALRDSHYVAAKKQLGHGEGYEYSHNAPDGIAAQDYLGVERIYYEPVDRGFEQELATRLEAIRAKLRQATGRAED